MTKTRRSIVIIADFPDTKTDEELDRGIDHALGVFYDHNQGDPIRRVVETVDQVASQKAMTRNYGYDTAEAALEEATYLLAECRSHVYLACDNCHPNDERANNLLLNAIDAFLAGGSPPTPQE